MTSIKDMLRSATVEELKQIRDILYLMAQATPQQFENMVKIVSDVIAVKCGD